MRSRLLAGLVLAVSAFAGASISSAATLDLTGAAGATIATGNAGVVTYNGNAAFGPVTFVTSPSGSDLTWSSGNGLGINCPSSVAGCSIDAGYQIDTPEFLTVNFGKANGVYLTSIDIGLLNTTGRCYLRIDETGSILGSGFDIGFDSDDATNGTLTVQVNRWVTSLSFVPDRGEWNDFTLARLRISDGVPSPGSPIPEPSSVLLMLIGGGIVASQVRARI